MIPRARQNLFLPVLLALVSISTLLGAAGCASHSQHLTKVRTSLIEGDTARALAEFEAEGGDDDDLLYLLELGYMLHLAGKWKESNVAFEAAEQRHDELYSKSISKQAASLLTSDKIIPYRGTSYEIQLVQYYRALNYIELGEEDEALVEARKANRKITQQSGSDAERADARQNAFLHYFTGLLYESSGDINDAIISFRDAHNTYDEFAADYGLTAPEWVPQDYFAAADYLGLLEETDYLRTTDEKIEEKTRRNDGNNLVLFFESGFVPTREPVDIVLPLIDTSKTDPWSVAGLYVDLYAGPGVYAYVDASSVEGVLRISFPRLQSIPSRVARCEVVLSDGRTVRAEPAMNLAAIAEAEFYDDLPKTLLKTVARAIAKEVARQQAKKEDPVLGWIVNAINVATEQADTRGWIFLPGRVDVLKAKLPTGSEAVRARFLDQNGSLLDEWTLNVETVRGETQFISLRSFH